MAERKKAKAREQRLWIVDSAIAHVASGHVTLQIDRPTRHLPRKHAFQVADKVWFAGQMRELEVARQRGETKVIPLTDRRRRSSLRLGGGFMITQGTKLILPRRHMDAPRPGQLCECGGVFEVVPKDEDTMSEILKLRLDVLELRDQLEQSPSGKREIKDTIQETNEKITELEQEDDPEDMRNDYIASLLKESQEIVLVRDRILYMPQLAPSPSMQIGFQPPGTLDAYNEIIRKEVLREVEKAGIPIDEPERFREFWVKILDYEQAVRLQFAYSPQLSVEITAEIDTSSLECVGVISLPQNIDAAARTFLEEGILLLEKEAKDNPRKERDNGKLIQVMKKRIAAIEAEEIQKTEKDKKEEKEALGRFQWFQYWDTELGWDKERNEEGPAVHRDIHLIDTETGTDTVSCKKQNEQEREYRETTTVWEELSTTKLGAGGTGGRFATEKLEKAIKMHCPFPRLQPLVRL